MIRIRPLIAGLIIPFSGFYITQIGPSPVYFTFVVGYALFVLYIIYRGSFHHGGLFSAVSVLTVYFFLTQPGKAELGVLINILISVTSVFVAYNVLRNSERREILRVVKLFIWLSIALLCVEALFRWMNPVVRQGSGETTFYAYKLNSLMYPDSNFVGLFIVVLFFLACYVSQYDQDSWALKESALFILALLTLSRGTIATILIVYVLWRLRRCRVFYIVVVAMVAMGVYAAIQIATLDQSFAVRFLVAQLYLEHLTTADWNLVLFGVGFGRTADYIGIGGHNVFVTLLMESGVVGLFLMLGFWGYLVKFSRYAALIVLTPFLINSQTLMSHAAPYLYVSIAIVALLKRYHGASVNQVRADRLALEA